MATINSQRPQSKPHHGKTCTLVRAVHEGDGEAFDVGLAKTVVKLDEDGREVMVANIELIH